MDDQSNKGDCYFTHNGMRFGQVLESVDLQNVYPVAHIQKKEVRIRANFGGQSEFVYTPANAFESSSEAATPEPSNAFEALPIGLIEDDEGEKNDGEEEAGGRGAPGSAGHRRHNPYLCRPALKQKVMTRYDTESSVGLRLQKSGNPLFRAGPAPLATVVDMDEESDLDDEEEIDECSDDSDYGGGEQSESVNALLVKIWESRVFPVIRRRFRNETERRDGLEQIKGALSLGMVSKKQHVSMRNLPAY